MSSLGGMLKLESKQQHLYSYSGDGRRKTEAIGDHLPSV